MEFEEFFFAEGWPMGATAILNGFFQSDLDAKGFRILNLDTSNLVFNASQITAGILPLIHGGTGGNTQVIAANNILPPQAGHASQFLQTDGAGNVGWSPGLVGPPGPGVPAGGTKGQVLAKISATNLDTHWIAALFIANAMDYGAVGDGVADDTAAINSAISSLGAGGVCLLPQGTYKVTQIMVASNVHIRGMGKGATVIKGSINQPNQYVGLIAVNGVNKWSIRDLTVDMGNLQGSIIGINNANQFKIADCELINFQNIGISIQIATNWIVESNYISGFSPSGLANNSGIFATSSVSSGVIHNNVVLNSAIWVNMSDGKISNNYVANSATGVGITTSTPSARMLILNNICRGMRVGTLGQAEGFELWGTRFVIAGNIAFDNDGVGMAIGADHSVICGNVAYDNCKVNAGPGIYARWQSATEHSSYSVYIGNVSSNSAGAGGPQLYGYQEQAGCQNVQQIGNNWNQNQTAISLVPNTNLESSANSARLSYQSPSWTPGTIPNGGLVSLNVTGMQGALPGDQVLAALSVNHQNCQVFAYSYGVGLISVNIVNNTGAAVTFGALTANITIYKQKDAPNY